MLAGVLVCLEAPWAAAVGPLQLKKQEPASLPASIPWQEVSPRCRELARALVEKPTLTARGPLESFECNPEQYFYFLDHPDRAVIVWRRLGAKCVSITPRGDGLFGWADENGSDLVWQTVHKTAGVRIWYAEGKVRPGPVLPLVPVKALVVLTHTTGKTADGNDIIQHRSELFVQTDSKTAATLTKMMGSSAQRVAEQGLAQLQMFFSALSWYLDRHPERATALLRNDDR
jgi:hypothetical protein